MRFLHASIRMEYGSNRPLYFLHEVYVFLYLFLLLEYKVIMQLADCPMSIFRGIDASCASTSSCSTFGHFSRSTTSATSIWRRKRWVCRSPRCRAGSKLSKRLSARHCSNDRGEVFRRQRSDANSNHCCAELSAIWNRRSLHPATWGQSSTAASPSRRYQRRRSIFCRG